MTRRAAAVLACIALAVTAAAEAGAGACTGTLYLTIDTGNMAYAESIAATLRRQRVHATFFLANEPTPRGDSAMDAGWRELWRGLAADGHAFGSHTWRHGRFVRDVGKDRVVYRPAFPPGPEEVLDGEGVCRELRRVGEAFRSTTGRALDGLWRAPGGRTTPNALAAARSCGYSHVGWTPAGFLGDELSSERHPNRELVERAVKHLRDGDVILLHMGIWSRKDPFQPMLDELLTRLQAKGFCFATLPAAGRGEARP